MPTVSIIVLNWNGKKFLQDCLRSLQKVKYSHIEIIVVDNNSSDGSQDFVKKEYPKIKLIENKVNEGFAEGNNIGFRHSKGKYVMFLNNDTVVTPNFLLPLISLFERDTSIGCLQPQMRVMKEKKLIDSVGSFMTIAGFLYHYGYRKLHTIKKYSQSQEIFSAKGACMILPRSLLNTIGVFDKDFFIFFEETDLCYRVWLSGHKVIYEPKSVIYHYVGGDTTKSDTYKYERRIYLIFRNTNCTYLKNFGIFNFLTIFPVFLFVQLGVICLFFIKLKFNLIREIIKAYWWNIHSIKSTLRKRKNVQKKIRKISDFQLDQHIIRNPKIAYYYYSLFKTTQEYHD